MKNLFRSDSEEVNIRFVWQSTPKPLTEQIKDLGDIDIKDKDNDEIKEKLKDELILKEDLSTLQDGVEVVDASLDAPLQIIRGLKDAYLDSSEDNQKILEKDVYAAMLEAVGGNTTEKLSWLAGELNMDLNKLDKDGGDMFGHDDVSNLNEHVGGIVVNGEVGETPSFSNEAIVKLYYMVDGKNLAEYKRNLNATVGADINLVKADMEAKKTKTKKVMGFLKSNSAELSNAYKRLQALFPDEFTKGNEALPNFNEMARKVSSEDELPSIDLYEVKKEYPCDYKDTKEMGRYLESIPSSLVKGDGYKDVGNKYIAALESGYRGTFEEWDDAQPRSGLAALMHKITKLFRSMGGLKGLMPEWLRKIFGGDSDEDMENSVKETTKYKEHAALMGEKVKAEEEKKTKESWGSATEAQKEALKDFNTKYEGLFSFEVATVATVGEAEQVSSSKISKETLASWHDEVKEGDVTQLKLKPKIEKVLEWANTQTGKGELKRENWNKLVSKIENGDVLFEEGGALKLKNGNLQMKSSNGIEKELTTWNDKAFEKIAKQTPAEDMFSKEPSKFDSDIKFEDVYAQDEFFSDAPKNTRFHPAIVTLLKKDNFFEEGSTMEVADLKRLTRMLGSDDLDDPETFNKPTGGRVVGKDGEEMRDDYGERIKVGDEIAGTLVEEKYPNMLEVDGSGYGFVRDRNFINATALFEYLKRFPALDYDPRANNNSEVQDEKETVESTQPEVEIPSVEKAPEK